MGRRDVKQVKCIACQVLISSMENKVRRKGKECGAEGCSLNELARKGFPEKLII